MSVQKNAPSTVGAAAEGQVVSCPIPEENPNMSKDMPTTQHSASEIADSSAERRHWDSLVQQWLRAHPEVTAAKPEWADTVGVDSFDEEEGVDVWFERQIGVIRLSKHATLKDGLFTWDDGSEAPYVTLEQWEGLDHDDLWDLAEALVVAIPVVEKELSL